MHEYKSEHKLPILLRPKWIWFRKYRIVNLVSSAANFNKLIWNNEFTAASLNWVLSRPNGIPISGTSKINFEFHNPKCWLQVWFYYCDCSRVCGKIQTIHSFGLAKQEVASTIQQERHKNKRNRNRKDSINPEQNMEEKALIRWRKRLEALPSCVSHLNQHVLRSHVTNVARFDQSRKWRERERKMKERERERGRKINPLKKAVGAAVIIVRTN